MLTHVGALSTDMLGPTFLTVRWYVHPQLSRLTLSYLRILL